ncbi:DUF4055 domain-containing protein [Comamonas squillarum]|uniref:DUF4055 domain-containing protein n=1 Tax=Comamonas squillarum TaxID=2977320 RepID=A0ABY6A3A0_9BURK|nr:DUF4055 domain-containing protein [Comamonas sp. PR12]UXC20019.1 DUF4055 domain-containing protein [Comamonas sp. PR12]
MTAINQQNDTVKRMAEAWAVIDPLMGGTQAMRKAGKKLLPQQPREDDEDYKYRLETATLFPAYQRTCTVMSGKPFSKQMTINEDVPPKVKALLPDIDGQGRSIHAFASQLFAEALSHGFGGVLVDFPAEGGQRPYWTHYAHDSILGWRLDTSEGVARLTQLRLHEAAEVEDGDYGVKMVQRVRVLTPGGWALYEQGTDEWALVDEGVTSLSYIPFVPYYGRRIAFMEGAPPLVDLAHQNVKHWQQQSDQDDSVRFARKRLLVFSGVTDGELSEPTAGSAYALRFADKDAKAEVIQGSAESVTVGRSELEALEDQMIQTGAELLVKQPGQRTATEASNDAEANKSTLQSTVEDFEDAMDRCLQITADWLKAGDGGTVSLFKDFGAATLTDASAQLVLSLQGAGMLTKETTIVEMQRRGVVGPDVDPEAEIEKVQAEGPSLGSMNGDGE